MQAPHSESSQPSLAPVSPTPLADGKEERRRRLELERIRNPVHSQRHRNLHAAAPAPKSAELAGTVTVSPRARATAAVTTRRVTTSAMARR